MSWFFKSKKDTPQSPIAEQNSNTEAKDDEDFVLVDDLRSNTIMNDPPPMYPLIPQSAPGSSMNGPSGPQPPSNLIQGVPFRLSKDASLLAVTQQTHNYVIQRAQAAISNVDSSAFTYDFSVEKSVLKETHNF
ncbi:hypothetical protein B566_EDAN011603 [Ephemera danica]|nr:hypothetical protein B566_EDAN011603 [Ephemera danica]